jgi:hypothetical protein
MDGWMDGWIGVWLDGVGVPMYGWMYVCMDGWMMDGWVNGQDCSC